MRNRDEIYTLTDIADTVPEGLPFVIGLTGFADAGGTIAQVTEYLRDSVRHEPLAVYDNDALLDYRARRPIIQFDQDHLSDYEPARLEVSLASDELGKQFLLMTGYEPDFRWEQFTATIVDIIRRFQVAHTTWVHAIPMPVPHTRPMGATVSGNRAELIESLSIWRPRTQVPANVLHLLEYRLEQLDLPVTGFALLVPHYLTETEYPDAALVALELYSAAAGLVLPSDELREEGREFIARVDEQVAENHELGKLVSALEARYDTYMEGTEQRAPFVMEEGDIPSADDIAAELERYLAGRHNGDDEHGNGSHRD
ncbi:Predicted ATP-dependent carboligase, ATP-grasp superfamily [Paramicrobacterium humi]|uniref:Predicted ATP-dependent carboligase, ATP-grasp superfamily n=1 Tax=Paramicrobacterium humi TaxID=640635 RepID=A0A1H4QJL9_9MICO|nr:PAC2 family protein [Microbacterium humi]SEC19820.1 Predicted ATP-dependent carboligase, ATP-grasp superfamily [Microbacterium humi]